MRSYDSVSSLSFVIAFILWACLYVSYVQRRLFGKGFVCLFGWANRTQESVSFLAHRTKTRNLITSIHDKCLFMLQNKCFMCHANTYGRDGRQRCRDQSKFLKA